MSYIYVKKKIYLVFLVVLFLNFFNGFAINCDNQTIVDEELSNFSNNYINLGSNFICDGLSTLDLTGSIYQNKIIDCNGNEFNTNNGGGVDLSGSILSFYNCDLDFSGNIIGNSLTNIKFLNIEYNDIKNKLNTSANGSNIGNYEIWDKVTLSVTGDIKYSEDIIENIEIRNFSNSNGQVKNFFNVSNIITDNPTSKIQYIQLRNLVRDGSEYIFQELSNFTIEIFSPIKNNSVTQTYNFTRTPEILNQNPIVDFLISDKKVPELLSYDIKNLTNDYIYANLTFNENIYNINFSIEEIRSGSNLRLENSSRTGDTIGTDKKSVFYNHRFLNSIINFTKTYTINFKLIDFGSLIKNTEVGNFYFPNPTYNSSYESFYFHNNLTKLFYSNSNKNFQADFNINNNYNSLRNINFSKFIFNLSNGKNLENSFYLNINNLNNLNSQIKISNLPYDFKPKIDGATFTNYSNKILKLNLSDSNNKITINSNSKIIENNENNFYLGKNFILKFDYKNSSKSHTNFSTICDLDFLYENPIEEGKLNYSTTNNFFKTYNIDGVNRTLQYKINCEGLNSSFQYEPILLNKNLTIKYQPLDNFNINVNSNNIDSSNKNLEINIISNGTNNKNLNFNTKYFLKINGTGTEYNLNKNESFNIFFNETSNKAILNLSNNFTNLTENIFLSNNNFTINIIAKNDFSNPTSISNTSEFIFFNDTSNPIIKNILINGKQLESDGSFWTNSNQELNLTLEVEDLESGIQNIKLDIPEIISNFPFFSSSNSNSSINLTKKIYNGNQFNNQNNYNLSININSFLINKILLKVENSNPQNQIFNISKNNFYKYYNSTNPYINENEIILFYDLGNDLISDIDYGEILIKNGTLYNKNCDFSNNQFYSINFTKKLIGNFTLNLENGFCYDLKLKVFDKAKNNNEINLNEGILKIDRKKPIFNLQQLNLTYLKNIVNPIDNKSNLLLLNFSYNFTDNLSGISFYEIELFSGDNLIIKKNTTNNYGEFYFKDNETFFNNLGENNFFEIKVIANDNSSNFKDEKLQLNSTQGIKFNKQSNNPIINTTYKNNFLNIYSYQNLKINLSKLFIYNEDYILDNFSYTENENIIKNLSNDILTLKTISNIPNNNFTINITASNYIQNVKNNTSIFFNIIKRQAPILNKNNLNNSNIVFTQNKLINLNELFYDNNSNFENRNLTFTNSNSNNLNLSNLNLTTGIFNITPSNINSKSSITFSAENIEGQKTNTHLNFIILNNTINLKLKNFIDIENKVGVYETNKILDNLKNGNTIIKILDTQNRTLNSCGWNYKNTNFSSSTISNWDGENLTLPENSTNFYIFCSSNFYNSTNLTSLNISIKVEENVLPYLEKTKFIFLNNNIPKTLKLNSIDKNNFTQFINNSNIGISNQRFTYYNNKIFCDGFCNISQSTPITQNKTTINLLNLSIGYNNFTFNTTDLISFNQQNISIRIINQSQINNIFYFPLLDNSTNLQNKSKKEILLNLTSTFNIDKIILKNKNISDQEFIIENISSKVFNENIFLGEMLENGKNNFSIEIFNEFNFSKIYNLNFNFSIMEDLTDSLIGNISVINFEGFENLSLLNLTINNSDNLSKNFTEKLNVTLIYNNSKIIEFENNFSNNKINLLNTEIILQYLSNGTSSILIKNLDIETTKSVYLNRPTNSNFSSICIQDSNVDKSYIFSKNCNSNGEIYLESCENKSSYTCEIIENQFKISGLKNTYLKIVENDNYISPSRNNGGGGNQGGNSFPTPTLYTNNSNISNYNESTIEENNNTTNNNPVNETPIIPPTKGPTSETPIISEPPESSNILKYSLISFFSLIGIIGLTLFILHIRKNKNKLNSNIEISESIKEDILGDIKLDLNIDSPTKTKKKITENLDDFLLNKSEIIKNSFIEIDKISKNLNIEIEKYLKKGYSWTDFHQYFSNNNICENIIDKIINFKNIIKKLKIFLNTIEENENTFSIKKKILNSNWNHLLFIYDGNSENILDELIPILKESKTLGFREDKFLELFDYELKSNIEKTDENLISKINLSNFEKLKNTEKKLSNINNDLEILIEKNFSDSKKIHLIKLAEQLKGDLKKIL